VKEVGQDQASHFIFRSALLHPKIRVIESEFFHRRQASTRRATGLTGVTIRKRERERKKKAKTPTNFL